MTAAWRWSDCGPHSGAPTVVYGENLATVHSDEAAEGQLGVLDPQLLGRLQGDALPTVTPGQGQHRNVAPAEDSVASGYLVVVMVNQSSDHVGLIKVQLLQLSGGVRGQINQLLLCHNFSKVFRFQMNVLQNTKDQSSQWCPIQIAPGESLTLKISVLNRAEEKHFTLKFTLSVQTLNRDPAKYSLLRTNDIIKLVIMC